MTGGQLLLALLRQEGVSVIFGNPGTTELPLMDALAAEHDIRYVMALQESVALAMADGYARASGRLGVVNLHAAPGLGNAFGMLYDAQKAGAPLLVTAGQQAQGFGLTEPNLYAELPPLAAPLVKWATEVRSADDLPRIIHRAATTALAPPTGPVFISLPTDVLMAPSSAPLGQVSRVAPGFRGDPAAIRAAAGILAASERPVIIAGDAVSQSHAHAELVALAELLGAPVYVEGESNSNGFPTSHPLFAGHLVRAARVIRGVLEQHDVLFSAGADLFTLSMPPPVEPVPPGLAIIHLDTDPWQLGKNFPAAVAILGDPKTSLPDLTLAIRDARDAESNRRAGARSIAIKARLAAMNSRLISEARALSESVPIPPLALMHAIGEILPAEAILVDESISSERGIRHFFRGDRDDSYHGIRGGGIGWGIPAAVGVKLAHPERPVVALVGDGAAMYTPQGLWTAAHCNLAIVFVILVNRNYNVLQQRLRAMNGLAVKHDRYVGMELHPHIDFVSLGRGLGVASHTVDRLPQFRAALEAALRNNGPTLIAVDIARASLG